MPTAYLDHAASSPLRPAARAALLAVLDELPGNPSGQHDAARRARRALDDARDQVAEAVGCHPGEVVFTSGGTEADNLAIRGVTVARGGVPWCSAFEHHAVLHPVEALGGRSLAVTRSGQVDLDGLRRALAEGPAPSVVSVMAVNNEVGVRVPLAPVADVVRSLAPATPLHVDAVAAAPWFDLPELVAAADLVSLSGHKFGAPKGTGALVVRRGTPLAAQLLGGGQERERRSGTPNVAGAAALGAALAESVAQRAEERARVQALRDHLVTGLVSAVPGAFETIGSDAGVERSPAVVHLCLPGVDSEPLLFLLDAAGVAASAASSCASGAMAASHVLAALGVGEDLARAALRLSLGWTTTPAEVDHALAVVPEIVARLRAGAPAGANR